VSHLFAHFLPAENFNEHISSIPCEDSFILRTSDLLSSPPAVGKNGMNRSKGVGDTLALSRSRCGFRSQLVAGQAAHFKTAK